MNRTAVWLLIALLGGACEQRASSSQSSSSPSAAPAAIGPVRLVTAGAGDVAPLVASAVADASKEQRRVLVYVGAAWCKPCEAFHHAAERGELDAALPGLTLVTFDADLDTDRLVAAGYQSRLIPLFAVPDPDGRATSRATSGARTGGDYVAELVPRVQALLAPEKNSEK